MRQLAVGVLVLGVIVVGKGVIADNTPSASKPTPMYVIHMKLFEDEDPEPGEKTATKVLGAPAVAVAEDVDANFHVGGLRRIGSEQIKFGTMAKARIKRADDDTLTVSGFVEVSSIGEQEEGFAARQSKSLHFSHTIKLGETLTLPARPSTNKRMRLEVRVDRVDEMRPVASRTATPKQR